MKVYTLIASLVIAVVLVVTAIIKLFYPTEFLEWLQFCVAGGEFVLAVLLLTFHRRLLPWILSLFLFAGWGGYSLFWLIYNLPCSCLGKLYDPPRGISFGVDVLFFLACCLSLYFLARKTIPHYKRFFIILFSVSLICGGIGFVFAQSVNDMLKQQVRKISLQMRQFNEQAR
jgi:hypothetical protein